METKTVANRIKIALKSKLPPATQYLIPPGDKVHVYKENIRSWKGRYEVSRVSRKIIHVTDGINVKPFNISSILPMSPNANDIDFKRDMDNIKRLKFHKEP